MFKSRPTHLAGCSRRMDERKHSSGAYRASSGGAPLSDGRSGGSGSSQRYMSGRNGGRGRPKERDGRDQRMRSGRGGRVSVESSFSFLSVAMTPPTHT